MSQRPKLLDQGNTAKCGCYLKYDDEDDSLAYILTDRCTHDALVAAVQNACNALDLWHTLHDNEVPDVRSVCRAALALARGGEAG